MTQEGSAALALVINNEEERNGTEDLEKLTKHHRKLKSDNGSNGKENLSWVPLYKHRAWHALYDDMPPAGIVKQFAEDYELYGTDYVKSDLMKMLHERWANSNAAKIKRTKAWNTLFAGKTLEEIVEEINTIWLDPAYQILIGMVRVKTVQLSAVAVHDRQPKERRNITRPTHF